ncbi:MAG: hypothetical protein RLN87_06385 [Parasphingopyxis sp.]|uniref:class I SAM-dependent methyltransferase n=1 Tax=Parasphingopyxis sp. TaxID=1920299 RepID=UPI00261DBA27|nr:hypothetical protein [uncultured Parasphingopyxis sp.]
MKKTFRTFLLAAAGLALPAQAQETTEQQPRANPVRSVLDGILDRVLGPEATPQAEAAAQDDTTPGTIGLDTILAADFRAEDQPRDQYRHPAETLAFFRVQPNMTVAEYAPGGGWYSRVLAPYIAPQGRYLAVNFDTDGADMDAEQRQRADAWPVRFATSVQQSTGVPASAVTAFESDDIPAGLEGSADRILIFRNIHSMLNSGNALSELRNLRALLADNGLVGVVQHRAPESASWADSNGSRGYVKQTDVVALFDLAGFELVQTSDINANPNDSADYPGGVWTLPPVFREGDTDRARYEAIGESDRMTLLFRKAR